MPFTRHPLLCLRIGWLLLLAFFFTCGVPVTAKGSFQKPGELFENSELSLEGNRITKTTVDGSGTRETTYAYDYENRLVEWIGEINGQLETFQYGYDHRTRRVNRAENGALTHVVFSGGTSVQEYSNAQLQVEYLRGSDKGGDVGGLL